MTQDTIEYGEGHAGQQLRRARLVNLDVLVADFDRVVVTAFDLVVDVEFCSIAALANMLSMPKLPEKWLKKKNTNPT